jgi:hypothetical protein
LSNFKTVVIRLSLDAIGVPGEYFRFPIKWDMFKQKLDLMQQYANKYNSFDIGVQWTCSNVSMFYLTDTYDYIKKNYPNIKFLFCNHVEWPIHMSAQVLPLEIKEKIKTQLENYNFKEDASKVPFYINHMLGTDLWNKHGPTFMSYLNDLDAARKISWKYSFKEMELEKYSI